MAASQRAGHSAALLQHAEAHSGDGPCRPGRLACQQMARILERSGGAGSVATTLDWAIKLA
jgi:hypothetical protein